MQLVREIQVGVDVNGDGSPDLDPSKITYFGQSFGGIYGTTFLGVEPAVHAGVVNVPGRLDHRDRAALAVVPAARRDRARDPRSSLYNAVPNATFTNFNENLPLSGQPILVDTVPGADAIQNVLDDDIWAQTPADPVAWASYIRAQPLAGSAPKASDRPVREGRQDRAEPDGVGADPCRRPRGPGDVLPERPRVRDRPGLHGQEPAHVPEQHLGSVGAARLRSAAADRDVPRKRRRDRRSTRTAQGRCSRRRSPGRCPRP